MNEQIYEMTGLVVRLRPRGHLRRHCFGIVMLIKKVWQAFQKRRKAEER
jgi:hypothetical protein